MNEKPMMTWNDAIEHIMRAKGCNRRNATRLLIRACREGELPAFGKPEGSDEIVAIPKEVWPEIH